MDTSCFRAALDDLAGVERYGARVAEGNQV
jgi:hypothetical protein